MKRARQSGFTLLELLLVIGVAALLLVAAVVTYRIVTEGSKANSAIRMLLTIRQQGGLAAQQQNGVYTGIAFDSTAGAGDAAGGGSPYVISDILNVGERNAFNGDIVIAPVGTGDVNLSVTFKHISKAGCTKLFTAIPAPAEIISVETSSATYTSAAGQIPVTVTNITAACSQDFNDITWVLP